MDSTRHHWLLNADHDTHARLPERPDETALDDVYTRYARCDPFLPNGFVEHATMGPEAMVALGIGAHVEPWLVYHRPRPVVLARAQGPVAPRWHEALGERGRHGDWLDMFETALDSMPYSAVVATWVPRLLPDVAAALFHGLIRTAHAVRALDHRNTMARRHELARGLALWASSVDRQAVGPGRPESLEECEADTILQHARHGAELFLRAPNVPVLHLVTGPMAYMMLGQHLDNTAHAIAQAAFGRSHTGLAARLMQAPQRHFDGNTFDETFLTPLAEVPDAHPAKLTDACLRAFAATQDAIFLDAAAKVQPREAPRDGYTAH